MRRSLLVGLVLVLLVFLAVPASAGTSEDTATCNISCTVDDIMEWSTAAFGDIDLANISNHGDQSEGSSSIDLYTNGNVDIGADNSNSAQLSGGGDTLVTEYKLEYDGDGDSSTGGDTVSYAAYDSFLSSASAITHVAGDGAVEVTLSVRASNEGDNVANAADYSAIQTLTASWGSQ